MPTFLISVIVPAVAFVLFLLITGLTLARLYRRATREVSLVRTGSGGRRVIIDGGALVIPLLHELTRINMQTMRLEVRRQGEESLITKDKMRVDVAVEFYVAVDPTDEGIARAAQALGNKTFNPAEIMTMVGGKLVGGLRSVSAQMTMDELHEKRSNFVTEVQNAVAEDLKKNGLYLESVSLTSFDQTPLDKLDPKNIFTATANKILAEAVAERAKEVAQIDADRDTAIMTSKQQAAMKRFEVEKAEEEARVNQAVEVATLRAREEAETAVAREEAERARRTAEIERQTAVETAEIDRQKAIEIANQDRQIAIAQKSEAESQARAQADLARADAVKAEIGVETARIVAQAERSKAVTILAAEEAAEKEATGIRVRAKTEREAAEDQAEAVLLAARAKAEETTILAEAAKTAKLAEAQGITAVIQAENSTSGEVFAFKLQLARLDAMPKVIAEMVRPAEKIDSIRVHKVDMPARGMSGGAGAGAGQSATPAGGMIDQVFASMGEMAVAMPALKQLGASVGFSMGDGLEQMVNAEFSPPAAEPVREQTVSAAHAAQAPQGKSARRQKPGGPEAEIPASA